MKHLYILILLSILQTISLRAQDYTPMVVDHARWIYTGWGDLHQNRIAYEILGDTIINDTDYKIAHRLRLNDGSANTSIEILNKNRLAYLREDTIAKKVYCLSFQELNSIGFQDTLCNASLQQGEFLLYDFDLNQGEVLTTCLSTPLDTFQDSVIVENISEEIFGLYNLRSYNLNQERHLIEGIGFDQGLFQGVFIAISAAKGFAFSNYCREEDINDCLSSTNKNIALDGLKIYPNPVSDLVNLTTNTPFTNITLYDQLGQMLRSVDVIASSNYALDISDIHSGLYVLKITNSKNENITKKIIKK